MTWFQSVVRNSACALVIAFTLLLGVELAQRIAFPWDLYFWPESPFLTNMLKLDRHLPLYSAPADGNSFIYSPGLDYVTYALLKPFGRQLDIRFCRLVTVGIGAAGALCAALAMMRLVKTAGSRGRRGFWFAMTWGAAALVLFKNFLAESPHPDNFHAFHALLVFWLTLAAVESRRFPLALLTMVAAGMAVLVKQTEALCFLGPAAAFALFNPWGWRRWLALTLAGGATLGAALWLLWLPEHARLYTLMVPAHQGLSWHKFYYLAFDLLNMQGGLLIALGCASVAWLWNAGAAARRYLLCWLCTGLFAVAPGLTAYFKEMGTWNNLMLSEIWLMLVVWPVFLRILNLPAKATTEGPATPGVTNWQSPRPDFCVVVLLLLVVLLPTKLPPGAGHFEYCRAIQAAVTADVLAHRKILVAHGAAFQIRAGDPEVPMDRANSMLELKKAGMTGLTGMQSRIKSRYYDRIYLTLADWYDPQVIAELNHQYRVESVIPAPPGRAMTPFGYQGLMEDCRILVPR